MIELEIQIENIELHQRGKLYIIKVNDKKIKILVTFHCINRLKKWGIEINKLLKSLINPEEVLKGHFKRYIAHKRYNNHLIRAVYEYDDSLPVVITVYFPYSTRYERSRI